MSTSVNRRQHTRIGRGSALYITYRFLFILRKVVRTVMRGAKKQRARYTYIRIRHPDGRQSKAKLKRGVKTSATSGSSNHVWLVGRHVCNCPYLNPDSSTHSLPLFHFPAKNAFRTIFSGELEKGFGHSFL